MTHDEFKLRGALRKKKRRIEKSMKYKRCNAAKRAELTAHGSKPSPDLPANRPWNHDLRAFSDSDDDECPECGTPMKRNRCPLCSRRIKDQ